MKRLMQLSSKNLSKQNMKYNKENPMPKYPEIEVKLVGSDGNAFTILVLAKYKKQ